MKVKCIDPSTYYSTLTLNKVYDVGNECSNCYSIKNDEGWHNTYLKERFVVVQDAIRIKQWSDLEGLESKDKWGNRTKIVDVDTNVIFMRTLNGSGGKTHRVIYQDNNACSIEGGRERVLEELAMCGFDVEFVERKPLLSDKQRQELEYMRDIRNCSWVIKNGNGSTFMSQNKPIRSNIGIISDCGNTVYTDLEYDFITKEDKEATSIEYLLSD